MVRVGWRPCPDFPRHCFYILTNPQILKKMAADEEAKVDKNDSIHENIDGLRINRQRRTSSDQKLRP